MAFRNFLWDFGVVCLNAPINELLDTIVEDARFEAGLQQVQIRYDRIGETLVKGCGELLHRAFENVLRNALRHFKPDGEVTVSAWFVKETRLFRVTIPDEEPSVTESDLSAIFEPVIAATPTVSVWSWLSPIVRLRLTEGLFKLVTGCKTV